MSTMTLTEVRDRLRDECAMVEGDATKYPECAYHVSASVLEDLVEALNHHLAQPAQAVDVGWKEAAIAWNVCASIHREYAKGKDPLFSTRQKDFVKHHKDARTRALSGEKAGPVDVARRFHDLYEQLAPSFGYETRPDTKAFDPESANGKLMIAVCGRLTGAASPTPDKEGKV